MKKFKIKNVLVTRSEKGLTFTNNFININARTHTQKVVNVSGAGDTCISVFSILLFLTKDISKILRIINQACSIVISKNRTDPIKRNEFIALLKKNKI